MLKQKLVCLAGLTLSGMTLAGTMGPTCNPISSTVPCAEKQWDIGLQALYLKPLYSDEKAYYTADGDHYHDAKNKWGWGFQLDGSVHFNTGNDLNMNWMHYDVTTQGIFAPNQGPGFAVSPPYFNSTNENRFDRVNLVLGQHVDFSQRQQMRFYGGLQYARISTTMTSTNYPYYPSNILLITNETNRTTFNGVGPSIGMDLMYRLGLGFSLTSNTASSLLYGSNRGNFSVSYPPALVQEAIYAHSKGIVPSLEEKLGITYAHSCAYGTLNIDGGYQALNYFNAINVIQSGLPVTSSDFGLFGPYFGIRWLGQA